VTIFLGCGFAAKYREGVGNFSVPLQWMLGLRRLKLDAIWLELLPSADNVLADQSKIRNFQRQLQAHGLAGRYCLLYQESTSDAPKFTAAFLGRVFGKRDWNATGPKAAASAF
jgi:hypothetical protein